MLFVTTCKSFNPRTHMGCDYAARPYDGVQSLFQSTHPYGVRQQPISSLVFNPWFQSTHPYGVRLKVSPFRLLAYQFQSTHPYGVRPNAGIAAYNASTVSIHAPIWGATSMPFLRIHNPYSFNPRTHMGCDYQVSAQSETLCSFNPRTHMGCDLITMDILPYVGVSIHAPIWGATTQSNYKLMAFRGFNPRTHMGCDGSISRYR